MTSPKIISLFSGCGGLDLGFVRKGYTLIQAYDHWEGAVQIHNKNAKLLGGACLKKSLNLSDQEIFPDQLPKVDLILGGPPCQGFSFAGKQRIDDPRNQLYLDFKTIVEVVRPRAFLMENVRGLEKMALNEVKQSFSSIGYDVNVDRVEAIRLGIPQRRERVIIVGTRKNEKKFKSPEVLMGGLFGGATESKTIMDAIGDLPEPQASRLKIDSQNYLDDHYYYPLSEVERKFIRHIPNGGYYGNAPRDSLPERLQKIYDNPIKYKSPRLFPKANPLKPSQTVPASSSPSIGGVLAPDLQYTNTGPVAVNSEQFTRDGIYTSPNESRRFTPREMARLQTFPDEFLFTGSQTSKIKAIGNAVPVKLAELYAEEIMSQIFN